MIKKTIALCIGGAGLAAAALVVSQGTIGSQKVQPVSLLQRTSFQKLGAINLQGGDPHTAFASSPSQMFGAGKNFVDLLGEDGKSQRKIATQVGDPTISPMGADRLLIGDKSQGILIGLNLASGKATQMMKLSEIIDPAPDQIPSGKMIGDGKLAAVGFDGKNALIALDAGFSSMIFKVDPETKRIVGRGFAGCPDPSAMTYHDGQVLLLSDEGSEISRFSDDLVKAQDRVVLPTKNHRGIGVKGNEIRGLGLKSIERAKIEGTSLSKVSLAARLDRVRLTEITPALAQAIQAAVPKRYAVLICGDLAENFSGECFWNDTVWMYLTLLRNGYTKEDIYVLYGDGVDYASANPYYRPTLSGVPMKVTDFAATAANVRMMFDGLKNGNVAKGIQKMDSNDTLFLWTFDHGGSGVNPSIGKTDSTLGLRGGAMWATEFAAKANAVTYQSRVVFMQQCYSGGFIPLMQNAKTYIATACMATEVARPADDRTKTGAVTVENEVVGGRTYSHGEFNYHITTALNRLKPTPPGGVVNADILPADTFISAFEMMTRNLGQESRPETPKSGGSVPIGMNTKFKK